MHLSPMRPFVAQPFAPASHGRGLPSRSTPDWSDRVPAISDRDGNRSRGNRNPRTMSDDGRTSTVDDRTGATNELFSQIINWELGSAGELDPSDGRSFSATRPARPDSAEPSIYDLLAMVAPPLA